MKRSLPKILLAYFTDLDFNSNLREDGIVVRPLASNRVSVLRLVSANRGSVKNIDNFDYKYPNDGITVGRFLSQATAALYHIAS